MGKQDINEEIRKKSPLVLSLRVLMSNKENTARAKSVFQLSLVLLLSNEKQHLWILRKGSSCGHCHTNGTTALNKLSIRLGKCQSQWKDLRASCHWVRLCGLPSGLSRWNTRDPCLQNKYNYCSDLNSWGIMGLRQDAFRSHLRDSQIMWLCEAQTHRPPHGSIGVGE